MATRRRNDSRRRTDSTPPTVVSADTLGSETTQATSTSTSKRSSRRRAPAPVSEATTQAPETPAVEARSGILPEARHAMISEAAYLRAEKRGFVAGFELDDWLAAEKEIDALLSAGQGGAPQ